MKLHLGKGKNCSLYKEETVLLSFRYLDPGLNHTEREGTDRSHHACGSQSQTSDVLFPHSTHPLGTKSVRAPGAGLVTRIPSDPPVSSLPRRGCHRHTWRYSDFYPGVENPNSASNALSPLSLPSVPQLLL